MLAIFNRYLCLESSSSLINSSDHGFSIATRNSKRLENNCLCTRSMVKALSALSLHFASSYWHQVIFIAVSIGPAAAAGRNFAAAGRNFLLPLVQ